jgi:hypothetical protein
MDDELAAHLAEWTAEARVADAAAARVRQRWLEQQAAEDVSLAGVVRALAERRADVAATLKTGATRLGRLTAVGADFVVLSGEADTFVPFAAIALLRPTDTPSLHAAPPVDDGARALTLAATLARLTADRPRVRVDVDAGVPGVGPVVGDLIAAGGGVLVVRLDGPAPTERPTAYLPLGAVVAVTLV